MKNLKMKTVCRKQSLYSGIAKQSTHAPTGAVIVEGVVGISVIISTITLMILLLINVGLMVYEKNRLVFVTEEISDFAARQVTESGWSWNCVVNHATLNQQWGRDTKEFATELLKRSGLPPAKKITVSYDDPPLNLRPKLATVTIELKEAGIIRYVGVFGEVFRLKDKSVAIIRNDHPPGHIVHCMLETKAFDPGPFNPTYGQVTGPKATPALAGKGYAVFRKFQHKRQVFKMGVPSDGDSLNSFWTYLGGPFYAH
jgi:hypothetical protein